MATQKSSRYLGKLNPASRATVKASSPVKSVSAPKSRSPKNLNRQTTRGKSYLGQLNPALRATAKATSPIKPAGAGQKRRQKSPSQRGNAPKVTRGRRVKVEGRHTPSSLRYKTGYWRPVKEPWMSDALFRNIQKMHKMRTKEMAKDIRMATIGDKAYGKEGPGHAGYGTGQIQKWADKMLKKGVDPHYVDLTKWFVDAAKAYNFWNDGDFNELMKRAESDPYHAMHDIVDRLSEAIPGMEKMSDADIRSLVENRFYVLQYGPDGRAK